MNILLAIALLAVPSELESNLYDFTLKNGLKVLVYVDSSAPVVSVNVYYRVGAYDEQTGHTGISHMLEHMTFKHTDIYRPGEFDRIMDSVGAQNNGFTSNFLTAYFENLSREHWDLGLKLEAARMGRCVFPDSEFASEHQVVCEERRLRDNNPQSALWETYKAAAHLANPQRNPVIGWPEDVKRFTVQKVRDWYSRYYNPANAVLVVAGHVRPDEVHRRAKQYFGRLRGKPVSRTDHYDVEPTQNGERRVTVRRQVSSPTLVFGYRVPGIRDSLYLAGDAAAQILAAGRNSRLHQELVVKQELATSCWAWNSVTVDPGLLEIQVVPKAESLIPRIESVIDKEVARLAAEPPSEREMTRMINGVLAQEYYSRDGVSGIAGRLASSYIIYGDWRYLFRERERLLQVTAEQVSDFCRRHLNRDNRTVGILLPEAKGNK